MTTLPTLPTTLHVALNVELSGKVAGFKKLQDQMLFPVEESVIGEDEDNDGLAGQYVCNDSDDGNAVSNSDGYNNGHNSDDREVAGGNNNSDETYFSKIK